MSKNTLEDIFNNLNNDLDIEVPETGHKTRFLDKLNAQEKVINITKSKSSFWKPFIGIAATITLLVSLFIFTSKQDNSIDIASISPEMAKTETLFMSALSKELENFNSEETPEYQELIVDALFQIKVLEEDYNQLIYGLKEQPNDELILSAMILNFQSRIDVLQDTKEKIEELELKDTNKEIII